MITLFLTGMVVGIFGCTPTKRLQGFQRRHPELFNRQNDTLQVHIRDTVLIPGTRIDTVTTLERLRDTVYLQKDNVRVQVYYTRDSIFLTAETDTVLKIVERTVKVPYAKYVTESKTWWDRWSWLVFGGGVYFLFTLIDIFTDKNDDDEPRK